MVGWLSAFVKDRQWALHSQLKVKFWAGCFSSRVERDLICPFATSETVSCKACWTWGLQTQQAGFSQQEGCYRFYITSMFAIVKSLVSLHCREEKRENAQIFHVHGHQSNQVTYQKLLIGQKGICSHCNYGYLKVRGRTKFAIPLHKLYTLALRKKKNAS